MKHGMNTVVCLPKDYLHPVRVKLRVYAGFLVSVSWLVRVACESYRLHVHSSHFSSVSNAHRRNTHTTKRAAHKGDLS